MEAVMVHSSPPRRSPSPPSSPPPRNYKRTVAITPIASIRRPTAKSNPGIVPSSQLPKKANMRSTSTYASTSTSGYSSTSTSVSTSTAATSISSRSSTAKLGGGLFDITPQRSSQGAIGRENGKGKEKEKPRDDCRKEDIKESGKRGARSLARFRSSNWDDGDPLDSPDPLNLLDSLDSPDMPTPKGVRDGGVPVHRGDKMAAYNKVQSILNLNETPRPRKKTRSHAAAPGHDDSPDPIDSLSDRTPSPVPSPTLKRQPLNARTINDTASRPKKPGILKNGNNGAASRTTSGSVTGKSTPGKTIQRTSSVASVISVGSSPGNLDADAAATPKPKPPPPQKKPLPSFKKKWDKVYTPEEWQTQTFKQQLSDMMSGPEAFFKSLKDDPERYIPSELKDKIKREELKQRDAEVQQDEEEQRQRREQQKALKATSNQAAAFFADAKSAATSAPTLRQKAFSRVRSEPDGMHSSPTQATPTKAFSSLSHFGSSPVVPVALTADQKYCAPFYDSDNLCPYCSEPLPKNPSSDLATERRRLGAQGPKSVDWRLTTSFCGLHRAETSTIPLGWRDGFPKTIDFENLDMRLETGFIHLRLRHIIDMPDDSKFFRRTARQILSKGIAAWQGIQAQASALAFATPGYYGELGQKVLIHHFQQLFQWGMLPTLSSTVIQPLSPSDFIIMVLVPETVTLLIMGDRGWTSRKCKGDQWKRAREEALEIRQKSAEYGRWRFREESALGKEVLEKLADEERAREKRKRLERIARDKDVKNKRPSGKQPSRGAGGDYEDVIDLASSSCSDTGSADPSEYGGDEDDGFWDAAVALEAAAPAPARPSSSLPARTFTRVESQSSTYDGGFSWDDTFAGAAVDLLKQHGGA